MNSNQIEVVREEYDNLKLEWVMCVQIVKRDLHQRDEQHSDRLLMKFSVIILRDTPSGNRSLLLCDRHAHP